MFKRDSSGIAEAPIQGGCQMVQPSGQVVRIATAGMTEELQRSAVRAKISAECVMPTGKTVNRLVWQPI